MSVESYIQNLRLKFSNARSFAIKNLLNAQNKITMQHHKAVHRNFQLGDKVLLFLPIPGSSLKVKYSGPYLVEKKFGKVNYVISTPDRRKVTQIVLVSPMKPYLCRPSEEYPNSRCSLLLERVNSEPEPELGGQETDVDATLEEVILISSNPSNSHWLHNMFESLAELTPSQSKDISDLIITFPETTTDHPGIQHDVELIPGTRLIKPNA